MAALNPALVVKLDLDPAGVLKGVTITQKAMGTLNNTMGKTQSRAEGLKKTLSAMWRITGGILLFNVIRKVTQGIEGLIKVGLDFEEQMYNINSVAQLSAEGLQQVTDQVVDLALDPRVKDGPAKIAEGLYTVTSAGYSTADALLIMKQATLASTAGMTTSAVAADVLVSTLGAYNMTAKDAGYVTNELFQIVNISKYTFEQLASSLATVTPSAANLGIGINEVGAAMATFATRGKSAETATVEMNAILTGLLKPTTAMKDQIKALGFESGEAMIEQLGFTKTMQVFAEVMGGSATKAAALFGDIRALRGIQTLTNDGAVLLTENLRKMGMAQEDGGAMTRALTEQMKSNAFQISVLKKNIQILAVLGFGMIAPSLNKVMTAVNGIIGGVIRQFRHFREKGYETADALRAAFKKTFTEMFGPEVGKKAERVIMQITDAFFTLKKTVLAVYPVIVDFFMFVLKYSDYIVPVVIGMVSSFLLFYKVIPALKAVRLSILGIRTALLLTNPWFLAIAIVVGAFYFMYKKNLFGIRETTKIVIDFIVTNFKRLVSVFKGGKGLGEAIEGLPVPLQKIFILFRRIVKTVTDFFRTFKDKGAIAAFRELSHNIEKIGRTIGNFFISLGFVKFGNEIKSVFRDIGMFIRHFVKLVDDVVHGRWDKVWKDLVNIGKIAFRLFLTQFRLTFVLLQDIIAMIPWSDIANWIWENAQKAFKALYNGALAVWKLWIKPWLMELTGKIVVAIFTKFDELYDAGRTIVGWIWTGMGSLLEWLLDQTKALPKTILKAFIAYEMFWFNLGRDIVSGIWTGIASLIGWLKDQLEGLAKSLPKWMKKPLGIDSPSKAFAEIGKFSAIGYNEGFKEQMNKVRKDMAMMKIVGPGMSGDESPRRQGLRNFRRGSSGFVTLTVAGSGNPAMSGGTQRGPINVTMTVHSNDGKKVAKEMLHFLDLVESGKAPA